MKRRHTFGGVANCFPTIFCLLWMASFLSGCRMGYLLHAASGQLELISGSIPIEKALSDDSLSLGEKDRLRLVARIKDFGEKELGLSSTASYTKIYVRSRSHPIYTISACPKDRLERLTWWFPVVGRTPYLGFFDLQEARGEKARLEKRDFDVFMGKAEAYSTLGWFSDPVTLNMLDGSVPNLANTILHEMTHSTLYLPGQGEFNEGLAVLVAGMGTVQFLEAAYGPLHTWTQESKGQLEDERIFSVFLDSLLESLQIVYETALSYEEKLDQRERIFVRSKEDFRHVLNRLQGDQFRFFVDLHLNNASLMALGLYHRYFSLFESVFRRNGDSIRETIAFFQTLSGKEDDVLAVVRKQTAS